MKSRKSISRVYGQCYIKRAPVSRFYLKGRSQHNTEKRFLIAVSAMKCKPKTLPRLKKIDVDSSLHIEYFTKTNAVDIDVKTHRTAFLDGLIETSLVISRIGRGYMSLFHRLRTAPLLRCVRFALVACRKGHISVRTLLLIFGFLFRLSVYARNPLKTPVFCHNDFYGNGRLNNAFFSGSCLKIIDFQDVSLESKWILNDVGMISASGSVYLLRCDVLREYMRRKGLDPRVLRPQIKLSLLLALLRVLVSDAQPRGKQQKVSQVIGRAFKFSRTPTNCWFKRQSSNH